MRIALIGNMNNCFFAQMRYLRDMGIDAHLFMYQNEQELFVPENDTFEIEKYQAFIHTLNVQNSAKGLFLAKSKQIKEQLEGFDFFVGCGVAPALFDKLKWHLDVFIPYSDIIELTSYDTFRWSILLKYPLRAYVTYKQREAVQHNVSKVIAAAIQEKTQDKIKELHIEHKHIRKYLLMVYNKEQKLLDASYHPYIKRMQESEFVIFSHARHYWKDFVEEHEKKFGMKGLHKLIIGLSKFVKTNPNSNPLLVFLEYGINVKDSKELIKSLGVEEYVLWLPRMARKNLLGLLEYSDIVVDAIDETMWGGVGFEGLSCGKVLMQNILYSDEEYQEIMGHPLPFIMRANSPKEVASHFRNFVENREFYESKAKENKKWFERYAGIGLAKEYKAIYEQLYREKQ